MIRPEPPRECNDPFLRRVRLKNYRSIASCDVGLGRLTLLVGRNGAGKSSFLDSLRFVSDGLDTSLDHAIKSRGGVDSVRRRSQGHPRNFAIELEFNLPDWSVAKYGFEIAPRSDSGFSVKTEVLNVVGPDGRAIAHYRVMDGDVRKSSMEKPPKALADRLYMVNVSGTPEFRPVYDALKAMGFYNLNPDEMKEFQSPDAGELLHRDGRNIASVVSRLAAESPSEKSRAEEFLSIIVPGISGVDRVTLGPRETLEFKQTIKGATHPWRFHASDMSDGTLRALGVLIAVAQLTKPHDRVRLVGIEEPETALHPAAAGALMDAIREATNHTQVILTTHSADLLDKVDMETDRVLVVEAADGITYLASIDTASRDSIKSHLYTAGELLRMGQLQPDPEDVNRQKGEPNLFDFAEELS